MMKSLYITLTSTWESALFTYKRALRNYKIEIYKEKYHATGSSKESLLIYEIYIYGIIYIYSGSQEYFILIG